MVQEFLPEKRADAIHRRPSVFLCADMKDVIKTVVLSLAIVCGFDVAGRHIADGIGKAGENISIPAMPEKIQIDTPRNGTVTFRHEVGSGKDK